MFFITFNKRRITKDLEALNRRAQDEWNQNAEFWDEKMGEGNQFQRILVAPTTERLLELQQGELILEIACGNGVFARRLAKLGAKIIATDFSENLLEQARKRTIEYENSIEYRFIDATNEEQLLALGERRFLRCRYLQYGYYGYYNNRTNDVCS
jgi:2-polyprenyl-3-methyl-5-hydroxy-6-metoxy-1,4-benzoquinol methylase